MSGIDLHIHSIYSDGSCTPREIVKLAEKKGLAALALTDHDTMDGVPEFQKAAGEAGIEGIAGMELSLEYEGIEIHLLGYFKQMPDLKDEGCRELAAVLKFNRDEKEQRHERIAELLRRQGIAVDIEKMKEDAGDAVMNRVHFARELVRQEFVRDVAEAFSVYLGEGKCCYAPRSYCSARQGIRAVIAAGGIPVLAHPWLYPFTEEAMRTVLAQLKLWGLKGVEAWYAAFTEEQRVWLTREADRQGLLVSGGTDFHGANKKDLELGTGYGSFFVPYKIFEQLTGGFPKESVKKD